MCVFASVLLGGTPCSRQDGGSPDAADLQQVFSATVCRAEELQAARWGGCSVIAAPCARKVVCCLRCTCCSEGFRSRGGMSNVALG